MRKSAAIMTADFLFNTELLEFFYFFFGCFQFLL